MAAKQAVYPCACLHCGQSIKGVRPMGKCTLDAALAVLRGGITSTDVGAALGVSATIASGYLKRAEAAGVIKVVARVSSPSGGGNRCHYAPTRVLRAFAPDEYRLYVKRVAKSKIA